MIDSIIPFYLTQVICYIGLYYVPPSSFALRFILVCLIAACSLISVRSTIASLVPGAVGYEYILGFVIHSSHWLLLAKLEPPTKSSPSAKRKWTLDQLFEARWGITFIPPFRGDDPKFIPSRSQLLFSRLWDLLWTSAIIYLCEAFPLNTVPEDFLYVPNGYLRRLGEVQPREAVVRHYTALMAYVVPYCTLRAWHSLATCVALAFGDNPKRWPPLFGSLSDAYTVRRFFSRFWHHAMRKAFTSHAILFVTRVLRLPRQGAISRVFIIYFTFMMSCVMHILANPGVEVCSSYPQFRYYSSLVGAMLLEDAVIRLYRSVTQRRQAPDSSKIDDEKKKALRNGSSSVVSKQTDNEPAMIWKLVGYTWVLSFNVWALSKLVYGIWTRC